MLRRPIETAALTGEVPIPYSTCRVIARQIGVQGLLPSSRQSTQNPVFHFPQPRLDSSRIADHAPPRMCGERTTFLRLFPSAVRRCDLRRRNLILEVVRIETIESAFGRFRVRIQQETDWRAVRPGKSDIVREVVRHPVHFPGPE